MPAYQFQQRYRSSYGQGDKGDVVDLSEELAEAINRDSPGTLEPKSRAIESAPNNRQVTTAKNRSKAGDA